MKKGLKQILSLSLATLSVAGGALMFTGCETKNPEVQMQLAFNGQTYTLEYKLYRNFATSTVKHFLKLVEEGYYNEENGKAFCVHHYTSSKLYTGGYRYDENASADGGLVYEKYYDVVKGYDEFPHSVWSGEIPTYTLYGEFANNGVTVSQGSAVKQQFGSLAMEYTAKSDDTVGKMRVSVQKVDGSGKAEKEYKYNSATSLFSINLASSVTTNSSYCTFATLKDNYVEVLEDLQDAIDAYIAANYEEDGTDTFADTVEITVDEDDLFLGEHGGQEVEYDVPDMPIYLNYVKVLKF